jgi:uncharacterized membrane protein YfcA
MLAREVRRDNLMSTSTLEAGRVRRRLAIWASVVLGLVGLLVVQACLPETRLIPTWGNPLPALVVLGIFIAALGCEYVDSALGMGYGTTLTPLLLLIGFEPLAVVPAVLLSECVTGLAAGLMHHSDGNIDLIHDRGVRRTVLALSGLSVLGALLAVTVALRVPKFWLTAIIAIIILSVGFVILATIRQQWRFRPGHLLVLGGIAAFNKAFSGGGYGPLVTGGQIVSGIGARQAVGITSLAEGLTCVVGLLAYLLLGGAIQWALAVPLTLGALLSVPVATLTVRVLPEAQVRGAIGITTCILGLLMVLKLLS